MESVCRHLSTPFTILYSAVYFLSVLPTDKRRFRWTLATATLLHRIRSSPAVSRHVFPPSPPLRILCCILTKSLTNRLPVSLVVHGLLPSDSVWVYWTTLRKAQTWEAPPDLAQRHPKRRGQGKAIKAGNKAHSQKQREVADNH